MARRRYQKGNIRKRGKRNPVWELQWWTDIIQPDGSFGRKRESTILGTISEMNRRQALKAADEFLRPLNLGKITPFSNVVFREFIEKCFIPNVFPILKLATRKKYRSAIDKHLLPAFGEQRLCDIGTLNIQSFVIQKMDGGLSWETANLFRNLISKIFATAKKWGYFPGDNPSAGVELPEKKAVREKHALAPEQISQLLKLLREPYRTMVHFGILTGLRVGEILGLRWKDVNFDSSEMRVNQRCYRGDIDTPKTKRSRRTLPLPELCVESLRRFHTQSAPKDGDAFVFHTSNGTPYNDTNILHRELKPAGRKIGAPWLSWHTFRRTHATLLQLAGGSAKDAQEQLGHSKLSTTLEIYTFPVPAHQRAAVESLSRLVTNGDEFAQIAEELPMLTEQIQ
jgi:integrase